MAGFRTFATGEVLTAANVNDFLMGQSVMRFADADARTAALGTDVVEGMLTYNLATDQLEVFDGTDFVVAAPEPPAGIGSNVVSVIRTTTFSTSSTTYTNWVGVDVTITPSSATSKVLVALFCGKAFTAGGGGLPMFMQIGRGTTEIGAEAQMRPDGGTIDAFSTLFVLDSPATASAVTYRGRVKVTSSGNYLNGGIVAIEVAA